MNQVRKFRRPLRADKLRPRPRDLFGEVPVTEREIMLWMWSVPVWMTRHARPRRIAEYVKGYDVVGKVRRAKLDGQLQETFGDETCQHCGALLEADYQRKIDDLHDQVAALKQKLEAAERRADYYQRQVRLEAAMGMMLSKMAA